MTDVVGTVQVVSSKVLSSGTYYSFCVDDNWYRTGKTPTEGLMKGHTIKFTFEKNQWGNEVDTSTIEFDKAETPVEVTKKPYAKSGGGGLGFKEEKVLREKYWNDKEVRDVERDKKIGYAGALNTAIALVGSALDRELIAKPTGKNLGLKFDAYKAMVEESANGLYALIQSTPGRHDELVGTEVVESGDDESFAEDVQVAEGPAETTDGW